MQARWDCVCGWTLEGTDEGKACPRCGVLVVRPVATLPAAGREAGFAMAEPVPPDVRPLRVRIDELVKDARSGNRDAADALGRHVSDLLTQVSGLCRNVARSVPALEDRLTPEERDQILAAVDRGQAAPAAALSALETAVRDLEQAAGMIGKAMLRDPPR
jgi:hypothetical protein